MNHIDFFFLRPFWLLLLIPIIALILLMVRFRNNSSDRAWRDLVDSHLLQHLTVQQKTQSNSHWLIAALACGLCAAVIAMAGPTWQKVELPSFKTQLPVVMALSLSQSMNATDVTPTRLVRAGHKVRDILAHTNGGDRGFIVYADRPFIAAPLTEDANVISQMLPELSTDLMPVLGNRLHLAIDEASNLLSNAGAKAGQIIIIADDAGNDVTKSITAARQTARKGFNVNVLGVGTETGAPLTTSTGQVINDKNGQAMTSKLDVTALSQVAAAGSGNFVRLSANDDDIEQFIPATVEDTAFVTTQSNLRADTWNDLGYWLLLIPVLLAPLAFRKDLLLVLPLTAILILSTTHSPITEAANSRDFWETPDQQAALAFQQNDFPKAAQQFYNPDWKASALYRAEQYDAAAKLFEQSENPDRSFNLGNALAHSGQLEDAIKAYDQAIENNPGDEDAQFNRDLIAKMLEQQKAQAQDQQKEQQQSNESQSSANEQDEQQDPSSESAANKQQSKQQNDGASKNPQSGNQDAQDSKDSADQGQANDRKNNSDTVSNENSANSDGGEQTANNAVDQQGNENKRSNHDGPSQQNQKQENTSQNALDSNALQDTAEQLNQDEATPDDTKPPTTQNNEARSENAGNEGQSAFKKAMDKLLQGNGADDLALQKQTGPVAESTNRNLSETEQAYEQQLRAVPDDPSGLLKARIRQHYARLRANSNYQ